MSWEQLAEIYLRVILQLIALGLLLAASWRLAGWLWPGPDWGERLVAAGLVTCCLAVVIVVMPGLLGQLRAEVLGGEVLAVWALVRWRVPAVAPLPRLEIPRGLGWPLVPATIIAFPFLIRSLMLVELTWDSLIYHMYFPAVWIQQQRVFLVDGVIPLNYVAFYPKNYELLLTFVMGIARNDLLAKLINLPLLGLTALTVGLICYQLAGSRRVAWCAGLFALTLPAQFCWAATTYVEPLVNFCLLAAVYFVCRAWRSPPEQLGRVGILAGLALGLAVGTKYTALFEAVLLIMVVLAMPLDRKLPWRAWVRFGWAYGGAALVTGIWWLAINTAVTGNPVYPKPLGSLPHMVDPGQPEVLDANIWNHFGEVCETGELASALFGCPPPALASALEVAPEMRFPWELGFVQKLFVLMTTLIAGPVGPDTGAPWQLGFGPKLLLLIPMLIVGLMWALARSLVIARRESAARAAPFLIVAASTVVMIYTYLQLPYMGGALHFQVRFASPIFLLTTALGFAVLGALRWEIVAVVMAWGGLIVDALILDLRFPGLDRVTSFAVLSGALLACVVGRVLRAYLRVRRGSPDPADVVTEGHSERTRAWRPSVAASAGSGDPRRTYRRAWARLGVCLGLIMLAAALFGVLTYRERSRYHQYASCHEVHDGCQEDFLPPAQWLQDHYPSQSLAYTGTFASFLYMFLGPQFERPVLYVSTGPDPAASYLNNGELRPVVERSAWEKNLKASGARFLILFQMFRYEWTEEDTWARENGFPLVLQGNWYRLYQVNFPSSPRDPGTDKVSQAP